MELQKGKGAAAAAAAAAASGAAGGGGGAGAGAPGGGRLLLATSLDAKDELEEVGVGGWGRELRNGVEEGNWSEYGVGVGEEAFTCFLRQHKHCYRLPACEGGSVGQLPGQVETAATSVKMVGGC